MHTTNSVIKFNESNVAPHKAVIILYSHVTYSKYSPGLSASAMATSGPPTGICDVEVFYGIQASEEVKTCTKLLTQYAAKILSYSPTNNVTNNPTTNNNNIIPDNSKIMKSDNISQNPVPDKSLGRTIARSFSTYTAPNKEHNENEDTENKDNIPNSSTPVSTSIQSKTFVDWTIRMQTKSNRRLSANDVPSNDASRNDNSNYSRQQTRPKRLFLISRIRRDLGAMFIEEIGSGGVFIQDDLTGRECFLLDTGRSGTGSVYVWFGSDTNYKSMALGTRVARGYLEGLKTNKFELNSQTMIHATPTTTSSPSENQLDDTTIVTFVYSGNELQPFKDMFRMWYDNVTPIAAHTVAFDPNSILSMEENEVYESTLDELGNPIVEKEKVSYRESHTYKRDISPTKPAPSSTSTLKTNKKGFGGINLKWNRHKKKSNPVVEGNQEVSPEVSSQPLVAATSSDVDVANKLKNENKDSGK